MDSTLFGHVGETDSYRTLQTLATEATLVYIAMGQHRGSGLQGVKEIRIMREPTSHRKFLRES